MATTTNYGWTTPDDTALVKDGASAIRSLGTSVDTTTKNLNPSTTLGDIEYRSSTANTNTRLGIGSTGNVLTVSGGVPTWAAPAGGSAPTLASIASGSLSGTSLTLSSLTAYDTLILRVYNASDNTESQDVLQINGSSASIYDFIAIGGANSATFNNTMFRSSFSNAADSFSLVATDESISSTSNQYIITLTNCKSSGFTYVDWTTSVFYNDGGTNRKALYTGQGLFKSAAAVSSLTFFPVSTSTYDAGTYELFGG